MDRQEKACGRTACVYALGKSDGAIVVKKQTNNGRPQGSPAESVERRASAKGNPESSPVTGAPYPESAWSWRDRIRQAARRDRSCRFTSLLHHITPGLLFEAYHALRREAAVGVDGTDWESYGEDDLLGRLADLHRRVQDGRYRALPSKRIWIPKPDGQKRPLGIPALEDKIVQQALVWVLENIYEEDFCNFSYGFRPGRSCHNALDAVSVAITQRKVSWILDADIQGFFDTVDHSYLLKFLEHRIADPRILRLVKKFLQAGVSEEGHWSRTDRGTPQGAVISPLLANIYLHYVLDLWVDWWRKNRARGEVYIIRYADDFVMGFQYREDAEAMRWALGQRMYRFGLQLHPQKTRLIEFGRFAAINRQQRGMGKPENFDFLGFTHLCSTRRSDGAFAVRRQTITKRLLATVRRVRQNLRHMMHDDPHRVGAWLRSVVQGHLNYFAVPGNTIRCDIFRSEICRIWRWVMRRRSQKQRTTNWSRFNSLVRKYIPSVRVLHPYPNQRFIV